MWYYIDGVYVGNVCICLEYWLLLNGVEKVDLFDMNFYKWFLINFDCFCLWVKDRLLLLVVFMINLEYLCNK